MAHHHSFMLVIKAYIVDTERLIPVEISREVFYLPSFNSTSSKRAYVISGTTTDWFKSHRLIYMQKSNKCGRKVKLKHTRRRSSLFLCKYSKQHLLKNACYFVPHTHTVTSHTNITKILNRVTIRRSCER